MTPQDIINAAKEWRDENPGKRSYIVLTADADAQRGAGDIDATSELCMQMLAHLFTQAPQTLEVAKVAIDNVEELFAKQLADELRKQFPKKEKQ